MSRRASTSVILLVVLVSLLALLSGATFYLLQQERTRSFNLDEQLRQVNQKYTMTQAKMRESERMVTTLESGLKDARTQIDKLNVQLEEAAKLKADALAKVEKLQSELEQQEGIRLSLQKKLEEAQGAADKVQAQLKILDTRKTELERKITGLQGEDSQAEDSAIDLGVIEVGSAAQPVKEIQPDASPVTFSSAQTSGGAEGQVMVVNKDYEFAVINLGSENGVQEGAEFSVFQDKDYIGDVRVEQLHDSMSAAGFLTPALSARIREGDLVIQKLR